MTGTRPSKRLRCQALENEIAEPKTDLAIFWRPPSVKWSASADRSGHVSVAPAPTTQRRRVLNRTHHRRTVIKKIVKKTVARKFQSYEQPNNAITPVEYGGLQEAYDHFNKDCSKASCRTAL